MGQGVAQKEQSWGVISSANWRGSVTTLCGAARNPRVGPAEQVKQVVYGRSAGPHGRRPSSLEVSRLAPEELRSLIDGHLSQNIDTLSGA